MSGYRAGRITVAIMAAGIAAAAVDVPAARAQQSSPGPLDWPVIGPTQRPWTRWWWHGSAVTDSGLTSALESYQAAGLGGVEITPIYGVAGYEDQFLDFLSPAWLSRLEHTLGEAARLGLGVDLAAGTGWPFGGPQVTDEHAAKYVTLRSWQLRGGERLAEPVAAVQEPLLRLIGNRLPAADTAHPLRRAGRQRITIADLREPVAANEHLQALALEQVRFPGPMPLVALVARSARGETLVLTDSVTTGGRLAWTPPAGDWTLHALFQGWHGKLVERAAPGGEGLVLDHFSGPASHHYLARFDSAFAGRAVNGVRAFFNDSYEVDDAQGEANWTPALFEEFSNRRGYDLRPYLPELFGAGDTLTAARVLTDYRETISDLLLERFTLPWHAWAERYGALVRNQAHGSPANILDLYGASDIPETEGTDVLRFKSASSAANVSGRSLVAAEAATWLNEHFLSSLADVKRAVDRYFLGGVNHIVYHGTAYSPPEASWPGWLFYAAVHFQPSNPLWRDFRALNDYVARAQSVLQGGRAGHDLLLYLPVHDRWARRDQSLLVHFDGSLAPFRGMPVAADAELLQQRGYTFDFVSDRQLQQSRWFDGAVRTGRSGEYRAVVVPGARLLPPATLVKLLELARGGATVIFHRQLPEAVPGLGHGAEGDAALRDALALLRFAPAAAAGVQRAALGSGQVLLGEDLEALLAAAGVRREALVDAGLQYVRRLRPDGGTDYFIVNQQESPFQGWVPLTAACPAAALLEPMTGATGVAGARAGAQGIAEVRLQLDAGASIIVRCHAGPLAGDPFPYRAPAGPPLALAGPWRLEFTSGGPELPAARELAQPGSWTELGGEETRAFSGSASYRTSFARPAAAAAHWRLNLGRVHESARVRLNGHDLGTLIGPTFTVDFPADLLADRNELEITVSNLMANRIAAMDRRKLPWKRFYNVNIAANQRANTADGVFDASAWQPLPSGLLGPVTLTPLEPWR